LKNEITRLTAVKALIRIASSELKIDLRPILADSLPILAGFLRKNQRALKLSSLALLDILVRSRIARFFLGQHTKTCQMTPAGHPFYIQGQAYTKLLENCKVLVDNNCVHNFVLLHMC
jgi:hypothetical protein